MKISIVVAKGKNNEIGKDNQLLWRLSSDLKLFKKTTLDHTIIMGRRTYESIGRPLPKRNNVIITRNTDFEAPGCQIVHSLEAALELCKNESEVFIIGGGEIYKQALPLATDLYLTEVNGTFKATVFFPSITLSEWAVSHIEMYPKNEKNDYSFTFRKMHRKVKA